MPILFFSIQNILNMTKYILSLAFAAILFAGCVDKKNKEHSHDGESTHEHTKGTHTHQDGSVHEDHQDVEHHHQEEFKVESDSSAVKKDSSTVKTEKEQGRSHDDGSHNH